MMKKPRLAENTFVAEGAIVRGDVEIQKDSSVWFHATLRAEEAPIQIGMGSNVQDGVVIHTDEGFDVKIGDHVTVGHNAIIHGCHIGDESLIGMGAIVLNGAKIGKNCLIGAGTLVTQGKEIPDRMLAFGNPAKVIRKLTEEEMEANRKDSEHYIHMAQTYHLKQI